MSPSPATGLSKGEREREINSTSFGECKTVPRMYLCLVMSCAGVCGGGGLFITKGVWQGHMPGLATKGQSLALLTWLDGVGGQGLLCSCFLHEFAHVAHQRGCITHLSCIHRALLTTFSLLSKRSGLIWDKQTAVKFYPFGLCTCFIRVRHCLRSVKVQGCNERQFFIRCQPSFSRTMLPLSKESGASEVQLNNGRT